MGGFVRTFFPYDLSNIPETSVCFNASCRTCGKAAVAIVNWKDATKSIFGFFSDTSHVFLNFFCA